VHPNFRLADQLGLDVVPVALIREQLDETLAKTALRVVAARKSTV
jgi:hypothetical protein